MNRLDDYLSGLTPNPAYGTGCFLRAWAFRRLTPDRIEVAMEDNFHALSIVIDHDDHSVTGIDARWHRHPISTCPGAAAFLATMVGETLTSATHSIGRDTDSASHCTHMFDSLRLGIVHIAQNRTDRRYDLILPDVSEGPQSARLLQDDIERLSITIDPDMALLSPPELAGAPLMRGLAKWTKNRVSPDTAEHLFMLQRALFVSWGRRVDLRGYRGAPGRLAGPPEGSCYASQAARYDDAVMEGNGRLDLTREEALHPLSF